MPVVVHGAESTKDSAKNRDRVAAKLSKPNLEVLLSTSETTPGLLVGEFSYKGKLVTFSKKSEVKKSSADTGVEDEEVLNVPPVQEQIKPDVIVDVSSVRPSEEPKSEQTISPEPEAVQEKLLSCSLHSHDSLCLKKCERLATWCSCHLRREYGSPHFGRRRSWRRYRR